MIVDSNADPAIDDVDIHNSPKYYNILGMDPRGVNNTTQRHSCFANAASRDIWTLQSDAQGMIGSSSDIFDTVFERKKHSAKVAPSVLPVVKMSKTSWHIT